MVKQEKVQKQIVVEDVKTTFFCDVCGKEIIEFDRDEKGFTQSVTISYRRSDVTTESGDTTEVQFHCHGLCFNNHVFVKLRHVFNFPPTYIENSW